MTLSSPSFRPLLFVAAILICIGAGTPRTNAATLLLLDTLALQPLPARTRTQSMPDIVHTVEVAVAVPSVPPGWECLGPIAFTPAWCATHSDTGPLNARSFQIGLFAGDGAGPTLGAAFGNTRFNMTLTNPLFPLVPLCTTMTDAASESAAVLNFSVPFSSGRGPVTTTNGGALWLVAYPIVETRRDSVSNTENAVLWSLLAAGSGTASGAPSSLLRDRNDYYARGWTTWTRLDAWEATYVSDPAVLAQSAHQVRARVELLGCTYTEPPVAPVAPPVPLPVDPPIEEPSPVATEQPSPLPVAEPAPEPSPSPETPDNGTSSAPATIEAPQALSTTVLVIIIVASALLFIPLLVGLLVLVRFLRRRSRLLHSKFSFRESMQGGGAIYEINHSDGGAEEDTTRGTSLVDLSASGSRSTARGLHKHGRSRGKTHSSSSSGSGTSSGQQATLRKKRAPTEGKKITGAPTTAWIPADRVMFPVDIGNSNNHDSKKRGTRGDDYSSGSESPALISEDEDTETQTGTPRANLHLADHGSDSSNGSTDADSQDSHTK